MSNRSVRQPFAYTPADGSGDGSAAPMSSLDHEHFPAQAVPVTPGVPAMAVEPHQRVRPSRRGSEARGLAWELLQTIALTLAIFLGVRSVVQNFRVEGASMEPTLQTGQYLLINKAAYYRVENTPLSDLLPTTAQGSLRYPLGGPQRGDIVVFRAPLQPDKDFIKRVIGLPGDTILVRNGQVFVNGQPLNEPYISFSATYTFPRDGQPARVPDGNYFVLGDNRPNSSDSHLGWFVPVENLVGRAWVSYWPPGAWGGVASASYGP